MSLVQTIAPFIGRKPQLDLLAQCLQRARLGHPQVVLVQGDAGVGKTRLLKEMRPLAERYNIEMCYGRCYEDLTLPYLPFAESLLVQFAELPEGVKRVLGPDAELIRLFLQRTETSLPAPEPSRSATVEQDTLRLFLALTRATIALAQYRPMALILDDLHWADRSSLDLFSHLVFAVADTAVREQVPLLIIAAYRPVDPEDRLARAIARFRREEICQTLELSGFNEAEIDELLQGLGLSHPAHQMVATVSEATHGNPLFIQEILHHLVQSGALQEQGGYFVTTVAPAELKLPDQITSVLTARVHELSARCRALLTLASCVGDKFSLPVLRAVSEEEEETLFTLLEEGIRQRLLVNEGQEFQFAHPLIRHVLYTTILVPRRQRMHVKIAEVLERLYSDNRDAHLLEITRHFVSAGPAAKAEKVVEYASRAGDYAFSVFAWGEAAGSYEAALAAADTTTTLSLHDRAELHYLSGLARYRDMDIGPCLGHYEKAIAAYRKTEDLYGLARVLIARTRAYLTQAAVPYGTLADVQSPQEVLSALGEREPTLRGRLSAIIAEAYWHARQTEQAEKMARQALAIGQANQDAQVCAYASHVLALTCMQSLCPQEALASWQDALAFARQADDLWLQTWPMTRIPWVLTALGRLEEAESVAIEACVLTRKLHNWAEYSMAMATLAVLQVIKGKFAAAERDLQEVMLMVRRSHYPWGGARSLAALACARWLRGAWDEAEQALTVLVEPGRVFAEAGPSMQAGVRMYRRLLQVYAGIENQEKDQPLLNPPRATGKGRFDIGALPGLCAFVEIAHLSATPVNTEPLYQTLALALERGVAFSTEWPFLLSRILGVAATLNRRWETAEGHFRAAIATATRVEARPELGRAYLDYACMLSAWDGQRNRDRAVELLKQASPILAELDMQPFLRQAEQLAETLHCELPKSPPPVSRDGQMGMTGTRLRVVFFSDMVGSTDMLQRLGDTKAQEVVHAHNAIVRTCLRRHGGVELQHTGDGFMASFASAAGAISCALAIHRALAKHNQSHAEIPIQVRIGLNAGEPLPEEGRLFGAAVNAAARICAQAQGGEVLVSEAVRQLVAGKDFTFIDRGLFELKGFSEPFRLYAVQGEGKGA